MAETAVNVYFKVTRIGYNEENNEGDLLSRLFLLHSVNFEDCSVKHNNDQSNYRSLMYYIRAAFPEIDETKRSFFDVTIEFKSKKFKLVSQMDDGGDGIVLETDLDFLAMIQLNKKRCIAGEPILLYIIDVSIRKASTIAIRSSSCTINQIVQEAVEQRVSLFISNKEEMEAKIKEQDVKIKRIFINQQSDRDNCIKQQLITSNRDGKIDSTISALNAKIKQLEMTIATSSNQIKKIDSSLEEALKDIKLNGELDPEISLSDQTISFLCSNEELRKKFKEAISSIEKKHL